MYLVIGLCLIICVIDFSEKNDDFNSAGLSLLDVGTSYYAHLIPYLANFLSPLMVFISTILVTARLAGHTEIIAMLAGGVSFNRILGTYTMGGILLGCVTFYMIGWVIPISNAKRVDFELTYLGEGGDYEARDVHLRVNDSSYVYVQHYISAIETGYHFTVEVINDNNDCTYRLKSTKVRWDSTAKVWEMNNYSERIFKDSTETYGFYKEKKTMDVGVIPEDFGEGYLLHQTLTIPQLKEHIEKERIKGTGGLDVFVIEYYERFAYPFAIIILTLLGVIVSARKSRDGIAQQLVVGFVLCFAYYLFLQLGRNFTQSEGLHPIIGVWSPNVVFFLAGLVLYRAIPK